MVQHQSPGGLAAPPIGATVHRPHLLRSDVAGNVLAQRGVNGLDRARRHERLLDVALEADRALVQRPLDAIVCDLLADLMPV